YKLIISVLETKPIFFGLQTLNWTEQARLRNYAGEDPISSTTDYHSERFTLGGRWFVGARGVLSGTYSYSGCRYSDGVSCSAAGNRFGLNFTEYDLFGTGASLALEVNYRGTYPGP